MHNHANVKAKLSAEFLHVARNCKSGNVIDGEPETQGDSDSRISCDSNEAVDDVILKWKYQHLRFTQIALF